MASGSKPFTTDRDHTAALDLLTPLFLTEVELAARWKMAVKTLRNSRVSGGHIPFVRIGRLVRYRLQDVEAYERRNTAASTSSPRS